MITVSPSLANGLQPRSTAKLFAGILRWVYRDLLEEGIPEEMAALVRQIETERPGATKGRRLAIVVEGEPELRALASTLLEGTELYVIECASAEAALAVLQREGEKVAFVFAAEELPGPRSGEDLVSVVRMLWPGVHVVITTDRLSQRLSSDVVRLGKPWRGLDVLIETERALAGSAEIIHDGEAVVLRHRRCASPASIRSRQQ